MTFSGWVATLAGWYVTEIGRQPWLVTGVLRTAEAAGPIAGADDRAPAWRCTSRSTPCCWSPTSGADLSRASRAMGGDTHAADTPSKRKADDRQHLILACHGYVAAADLRRLMGLSMLIYVVLDGYDLGVGILLPGRRRGREGPHDRVHRAVLGRQRDLARALGRHPADRLPESPRGDPHRALPAGRADAGRA
jgi:hypothetical protein